MKKNELEIMTLVITLMNCVKYIIYEPTLKKY